MGDKIPAPDTVDLSVVIPFYNAAETLERCLSAIEAQNFPRDRYEIIAIDNNSTDGSAAIVRRFPRVTLLTEGVQGAYAARNRGVNRARGRILVFTDPDCVPHPDWLASIAKRLEVTDTEVLIGGYIPPRHSTALRLLVLYENTKDEFVFDTGIPELYYGHTNNMAVKRPTFERFGPFIERRRGADTIFVRHVVGNRPCNAVRYDSSTLVEHLEVDSVATYYHKMATYGESRESYRHQSWTRPLNMKERVRVFERTVKNNHLSPLRAAQLATLLTFGLVSWRVGRARAQLKRIMGTSSENAQSLSHTSPALDQSRPLR